MGRFNPIFFPTKLEVQMADHRLRTKSEPEDSYVKRMEAIIEDLKIQVAFYKNELELVNDD